MIATIELFEALKTRFGEPEAKIIVQEIEKIEIGIETKIDKAFEQKKDILATKEDIGNVRKEIAESKADMIKWMFIFWASQLIAIFTFLKFLK